MSRGRRALRRASFGAVTLLLGAAAPATAQSGAMWVDEAGRMMSLSFAGSSGFAPDPVARTEREMAQLFKQICLDTEADPAKAGDANLTADPQTLPGGKKMPPVTLNVWRGEGLVVSQTSGFFAAPNAQCNTTFYLSGLASAEAVATELGTVMGGPPSNASEAVKKNGKPYKYWSPEWRATVSGSPWIVSAHVTESNPSMPGNRVQITARSEQKAK